jgi:hypothetical protein
VKPCKARRKTVRITQDTVNRLRPGKPHTDKDGTQRWALRDRGLIIKIGKSDVMYHVQADLRQGGKREQTLGDTLGPARTDQLQGAGRLYLKEAQDLANVFKAQVRAGGPTQATPDEKLTLREAWKGALEQEHLSPRTRETYAAALRLSFSGVADRALVTFTKTEIDKLHRTVSDERGRIVANRDFRAFSSVWNHAAKKRDAIGPCPTSAIDWNSEKKRRPTLFAKDLPRWWEETEMLPGVRRDLHRFMLLTGMRIEAAGSMRTEDLHLDQGYLHVPAPKGGTERAFNLPLSRWLVEMLRRHTKGEWVWPSTRSRSGHVVEPTERGWLADKVSGQVRKVYQSVSIGVLQNAELRKLLVNHKVGGLAGHYIFEDVVPDDLREAQEAMSSRILGLCGLRT